MKKEIIENIEKWLSIEKVPFEKTEIVHGVVYKLDLSKKKKLWWSFFYYINLVIEKEKDISYNIEILGKDELLLTFTKLMS